MIINFLLPCEGDTPIGGLKIVYEYANGLVTLGHSVNLIHPHSANKASSVYERVKSHGGFLRRKINKHYLPNKWFKLDNRVNAMLVPSLEEKYIPDADFLFSTAWETASASVGFSIRKGKKYYLIQSFEIWSGAKEEILKTFRFPFKKIVVSKWLRKLVNLLGEKSIYIPNAFDFEAFGMDILPEKRDKFGLMMLYHKHNWKGTSYGMKAIMNIKKRIPELKLILYGVFTTPSNLPNWISFYEKPKQILLRRLYNEASIFISPSLLEGFPLPPAEAMISGAALVASDIGGHREYAIHNETALLYSPRKMSELEKHLIFLVENPDVRIKLAYNGMKYLQSYTWDKSIKTLEEILKNDS